MNIPKQHLHRVVPVILAGISLATVGLASAQAQQAIDTTTSASTAAPAPDFSADLGHLSKETTDGASKSYQLSATQPAASKLVGQQVRLTIAEKTPRQTSTRALTLRTGKHKTVAQFCDTLRGILSKFGRSPVGQELGKIGDLKYGGEIRFVAESPEILRYDTRTEGEPDRVSQLSASDVTNIVALLGQVGAPTSH